MVLIKHPAGIAIKGQRAVASVEAMNRQSCSGPVGLPPRALPHVHTTKALWGWPAVITVREFQGAAC